MRPKPSRTTALMTSPVVQVSVVVVAEYNAGTVHHYYTGKIYMREQAMRRNTLIFVWALVVLLVCPGSAYAQRVFAIKTDDSAFYNEPLLGFESELRKPVKDFDIDKDMEKGLEIAREINEKKPDLVVAIGSMAAHVAHQEIHDAPILFCMVLNPERYSLVSSRNVTGVSLNVPAKDQLEMLRSVRPGIKTVGVLANPANSGRMIEEGKAASRALGIDLVIELVRSEEDALRALRSLRGKIDALLLLPDKTVLNDHTVKFIVLFAHENRIPVMSPSPKFVARGALLAPSVDFREVGRQAGRMAKRILAGTRPQDLPVEGPEELRVVINRQVAGNIGLKIPASVLAEAKIVE